MKPLTTATFFCQPISSLSMTADSTVRMNGSTKKIAIASAIGMNFRAMKKSVLLAAMRAPRSMFGQKRLGTRPAGP
jgi:hypothetical protein